MLGLYWGNIGVILGLCWCNIGVILGLYWCNIGVILGLYWCIIGVSLGFYWCNIGVSLGLYWGYIVDPTEAANDEAADVGALPAASSRKRARDGSPPDRSTFSL